VNGESATVAVTLRIPEPSGRVRMCEASVTLLVDDLTAAQLVVVPRIRVEIYRHKDDLDWLTRDADADVELLTGEIGDALAAVSP
jgi:hypothetical protein